jgi:hypothetical protein
MGCARSSSHTAPGTGFTISTPRRPRLRLDELLAATAVDTELMLDLKGPRYTSAWPTEIPLALSGS